MTKMTLSGLRRKVFGSFLPFDVHFSSESAGFWPYLANFSVEKLSKIAYQRGATSAEVID